MTEYNITPPPVEPDGSSGSPWRKLNGNPYTTPAELESEHSAATSSGKYGLAYDGLDVFLYLSDGISWNVVGSGGGDPDTFTGTPDPIDFTSGSLQYVAFDNTGARLGAGVFSLSGTEAANISLGSDRSTVIQNGEAAYNLSLIAELPAYGADLAGTFLDVESTQGDYQIPLVGVVPAYLPSTIPGYIADWNAKSIVALDGDPITSWPGHTVPGDAATKRIAAGDSVYRLTGMNGHPALDFNANISIFEMPNSVRTAALAGTGIEIWTVLKEIGNPNSLTAGDPIGWCPNEFGNGLYAYGTSPNYQLYNGFCSGGAPLYGILAARTAAAMQIGHIFRQTCTGVSGAQIAKAYHNGTQIGSQQSVTVATANPIRIGNNYNPPSIYARFYYAHILMFDRQLNGTEVSALKAFLDDYWTL